MWGGLNRAFIASSLPLSHFETAAEDVLSLYERLTGEQLDMNVSADLTEDEDYC
jgi:hypothetical protein